MKTHRTDECILYHRAYIRDHQDTRAERVNASLGRPRSALASQLAVSAADQQGLG